jgi:hypothetical protein
MYLWLFGTNGNGNSRKNQNIAMMSVPNINKKVTRHHTLNPFSTKEKTL